MAAMEPHISRVQLMDEQTMAERTAEHDREKNAFMREYFETSGGRTWKNYWPREPVKQFLWNITEIGQTFAVNSSVDQYVDCDESIAENEEWIVRELTVNDTVVSRMCRKRHATKPMTIRALCNAPRIGVIDNFISDAEIEHLKLVGSPKLRRSTVAQSAIVTTDRTSSTAWVERDESSVIDDIVKRIGHAVKMDPSRLFTNSSSETLQLVHYSGGELYKSHYDYNTHTGNSRFITFLMYLNTPGQGGGNTSFPKAAEQCLDNNGYFGAAPQKGQALFFYNLFEDGNVDDLTLHFAEPPVNGTEKWMTNLWIWDPFFG
jgi:prolyl 4-hydroxylase